MQATPQVQSKPFYLIQSLTEIGIPKSKPRLDLS